MPNWRRAHVPGGSFFFTLVADGRAPIFRSETARTILGTVIRECLEKSPFRLDAIVLLPEHLHSIWSLPAGDSDYPGRWGWIKKEFTKRWLGAGGHEQPQSAGRIHDRRKGVWQPKYWEHTLEDDDDYERHFDYVHFNPVKHGHVRSPRHWPHSSFHRWVKAGVYPDHWGCYTEGWQPDFSQIENTVGE